MFDKPTTSSVGPSLANPVTYVVVPCETVRSDKSLSLISTPGDCIVLLAIKLFMALGKVFLSI